MWLRTGPTGFAAVAAALLSRPHTPRSAPSCRRINVGGGGLGDGDGKLKPTFAGAATGAGPKGGGGGLGVGGGGDCGGIGGGESMGGGGDGSGGSGVAISNMAAAAVGLETWKDAALKPGSMSHLGCFCCHALLFAIVLQCCQ